jgi:glycosyltransferase involved in cell wall biosynthesis
MPPFPRFELARNFRAYQARLNAWLARIRPDVVHAQGGADHAYVSLRSGYPTVVTIHGVHGEDAKYDSTFRLRVRNFLVSWLIGGYVMRRVGHLIAIGRYVMSYYASQLRRDVQVYYVPNAIDESFFNLSDTGSGQTVLYAGRVIARKRVLELVKAFARVAASLPSARLRIAGECDSEAAYAHSVRDFIQAANLVERVQLLGALPEMEVLREFAACDVLALSSAQETTPMVIAQAMAAGKPVVATPVGGVAEMVRHGETGFLVGVGDVDDLAATLVRTLQDAALRARLGEAGRRFAAAHYRADSVARRTRDVYQSMIGAAN